MNYLLASSKIESELIYGYPTNKKVDFSIAVPTYKRSEYLKKTVSAIYRKNINRIKCEVLIVLNNSEFELGDLIKLLNADLFKVYRNKENLGMVGNMNRCAMLSRGKYISYNVEES